MQNMMRFTRLAVTAVVLCLSASVVTAQRQLQLLATISDPSGAEVAAVEAKEVRVTENGVEATILKVEPVNRVPKVQVLVDNGIGIPPESLGDLRTGVRGLLEALPPDVEVALVSTAPQPRFLERATKDREKLLQAVNRLASDSGAGRFVESMFEATQRIESDKQQDASYTIVSIGSSSGDTNVRERDVQQIMDRVQQRRTTVHVALLTTVGRTASGGVIQSELGQAVTKATGGRYEGLAVANRLATLLPELGTQIAKTVGGGSRQFRITIDRPGGASGDLGKLAMGVAGKAVSNVSIDRR
jgi:hypothetical protein